jgi:hypothetical protein
MIDVERLVRDALARHESEVPTPDPLEAHPTAVRTRRRQVLNAVGAGLIAVVIALGAASGIGTLRAEGTKPADDSTETPAPPNDLGAAVPGPFEAPAQAPIVVGSDRTRGWTWMLSSSADGRCLAFTDRRGSEVDCSGPSGAPIDAYVDGGQSPVGLTFVFGRLPREANVVRLSVPSRHSTTGKVFVITPRGLNLDHLLFVGYIEGFDHPLVPDTVVQAVDTPAEAVIASRPLERPTWARAPFSVIATVASGMREAVPLLDVPRDWEIDLFRDEQTGKVCLGEPGRASACGDAEDPVREWISTWSSFEIVTNDLGACCMFGSPRFVWGVYREPVASIEVEIRGQPGRSSEWLPAEPRIYGLPDGYDAFTVFVVECDCWGLRVHTFAADGSEIGLDRFS